MSFRDAVRATPDIAGAYRPGLRALRAMDRDRVSATRPRNLTGSVDLDAALRANRPDDPRWDYGIGAHLAGVAMVFWVEVHPATEGEIDAVLAKLAWLKQWLRDSAEALNGFPREFVWISSGRAAITQKSPKLKRLALAGGVFKGGYLRIA